MGSCSTKCTGFLKLALKFYPMISPLPSPSNVCGTSNTIGYFLTATRKSSTASYQMEKNTSTLTSTTCWMAKMKVRVCFYTFVSLLMNIVISTYMLIGSVFILTSRTLIWYSSKATANIWGFLEHVETLKYIKSTKNSYKFDYNSAIIWQRFVRFIFCM